MLRLIRVATERHRDRNSTSGADSATPRRPHADCQPRDPAFVEIDDFSSWRWTRPRAAPLAIFQSRAAASAVGAAAIVSRILIGRPGAESVRCNASSVRTLLENVFALAPDAPNLSRRCDEPSARRGRRRLTPHETQAFRIPRSTTRKVAVCRHGYATLARSRHA